MSCVFASKPGVSMSDLQMDHRVTCGGRVGPRPWWSCVHCAESLGAWCPEPSLSGEQHLPHAQSSEVYSTPAAGVFLGDVDTVGKVSGGSELFKVCTSLVLNLGLIFSV